MPDLETLDLKAALSQVPVLAELDVVRLDWLIQQGQEVWLEAGQVHRHEGDPADAVFIMLMGEIRVYQSVGQQELVLATYQTQELFGELPILTGEEFFWAAGRAVARCRIFELPKAAFWELLACCPTVTTSILSTMAQRMQAVQGLYQQREKLAALGTLAAGLAHEMNNPAAAVSRAARELADVLGELAARSHQLIQLSTTQSIDLKSIYKNALDQAQAAPPLDPLSQSDREDALLDWLEQHSVADAWEIAPTLAAAGIEPNWLDSQQPVLEEDLSTVLGWLAATLTGSELVQTVQHGSERLSTLVNAIKDYSYMDQAPLQEIDIHQGLESTLTILGHRLQQIEVTRDYGKVPKLMAYGSELNQVWTNLIDNAIDAMDSEGKLTLRTLCEKDHILVEVADNGPGIPPDLQHRILEPFFTTKAVGQGTGLGLDRTYRIVSKHSGHLYFTSEPGNTRFHVRLPVHPPDSQAKPNAT